MEHLIELKNVYKIYQMGEETVAAVAGGGLGFALGKSTAMNIIGCLDVAT